MYLHLHLHLYLYLYLYLQVYPADEPTVVNRAARLCHHRLPLHLGTHSHLLRSYQVLLVLVLLLGSLQACFHLPQVWFGPLLLNCLLHPAGQVDLPHLLEQRDLPHRRLPGRPPLLCHPHTACNWFALPNLTSNRVWGGGVDLNNQTLPHLIFGHSNQCLFQTLYLATSNHQISIWRNYSD